MFTSLIYDISSYFIIDPSLCILPPGLGTWHRLIKGTHDPILLNRMQNMGRGHIFSVIPVLARTYHGFVSSKAVQTGGELYIRQTSFIGMLLEMSFSYI